MNRVSRTIATFIFAASFSQVISAATQEANLPALNALNDQTSISGLSSGAFMAAQFHIAYSEDLVGAGIVAGGPWNCANTNPAATPLITATSSCMNPCKGIEPCFAYPDANYLAGLAKESEQAGDIAKLDNILDDKIYLFSGQADSTVKKGVVDSAVSFYTALGMNTNQMYYNAGVDAGHAFITNDDEDTECNVTEPPYINDCDIHQAYRILDHIYGPLNAPAQSLSGQLITFNQSEFFSDKLASMDNTAYVYVPESCQSKQCRIHVAMHGCQQGTQTLGTEYVTDTGYNEVADTNDIIVLYPQAIKSEMNPFNPEGCWDFWGYTNRYSPPYNYYKRSSTQMTAIKAMIDRLTSSK